MLDDMRKCFCTADQSNCTLEMEQSTEVMVELWEWNLICQRCISKNLSPIMLWEMVEEDRSSIGLSSGWSDVLGCT